MAPIGSTISFRLIGVLLVAVVLFNLAMASAFFAPLGRQGDVGDRLPFPRQMAAIVDVIDQASPAERPRILTALNSQTLSVGIVKALPVAVQGGQSAPLLTRFLDRYDEAFAARDIHVDLQRNSLIQNLGGGDRWSAVRVFAKLADGNWVVLQPVRSALLGGMLWRGLLIVGLAGTIVIVLLVIAVRQTARPIEMLAKNATAFADRLDAPDLDVRGSKELRQLAASFNDMKTRIRSLVQERTRLVAAIAHDLRTYLTRLRMRAEFITDASQRERAENDIREMSELIDDTMLFARTAEERRDDRITTDVSDEIVRFVKARHETGDPVTLAPVSDTMPALISPVALRRILANLTDNAIRYGKKAELSAWIYDGAVVIEVADRGVGIPEADLSRVVAPFERLEPSRGRTGGGAGLGLAIVKALAELHGGEFRLGNRDGGGTIARVTLRQPRPNSEPSS